MTWPLRCIYIYSHCFSHGRGTGRFFGFFCFLFYLFIIICKYTVAGFRCTRKGQGGCEPPCGCWDLNSGPLEEQSVLLPTEPSRQPRNDFYKKPFISCWDMWDWLSLVMGSHSSLVPAISQEASTTRLSSESRPGGTRRCTSSQGLSPREQQCKSHCGDASQLSVTMRK